MTRVSFALLCVCLSISVYAQDRPSSNLAPQSIDAAGIKLAEQRIAADLESGSTDSPGEIVVVYFTPKDRPPAKDHTARIRRIVQTTASFYEDELARHGFANRKMNVHRDDDSKIAIIDVEGKNKGVREEIKG